MDRARPNIPFPASFIVIIALLAVLLIVGGVLFVVFAFVNLQANIRQQELADKYNLIRHEPASLMLYQSDTHDSNLACDLAYEFEVRSAGMTFDEVISYYSREFVRLGWGIDPRNDGFYISENMRVDIVEGVPASIGSTPIPGNIRTRRQPNATLYTVVASSWRSDHCPSLNRSAVAEP